MSSPARPSRARLRDRYDRKQQELVRGAAKIFAEHGYDQTTIQDLAEQLDASTGSMYHYVRGKEALLALICDQLMDPLLERARELCEQAALPSDKLRALVRLWVEHVTEHRDHMLVFQQERHVIERGQQWRGVRQSRKQFERLLEGVLDELHELGQLALSDQRQVLLALLGMVNHTAQWYRPRGPLSPTEIADGYVDLLVAPRRG
jgi:TetR/AcrR family transcriptional regulator, cholesterol catabolism regulator